jgi:hypothetical protein
MNVQEFIIANWKSAEALRTLLGADFPKMRSFTLVKFPQNKQDLR